MPTYTYYCDKCKIKVELFFHLSNYDETPKCSCKAEMRRSYSDDICSMYSCVKKSDSELKTIGDIANRNRDKLSEDEKTHLYEKHNKYKDQDLTKQLPQGMKRIQKPKKKIKWT